MAERVGFEPTVPFEHAGFQDRSHKPLDHLSVCFGKMKILLGTAGARSRGTSFNAFCAEFNLKCMFMRQSFA